MSTTKLFVDDPDSGGAEGNANTKLKRFKTRRRQVQVGPTDWATITCHASYEHILTTTLSGWSGRSCEQNCTVIGRLETPPGNDPKVHLIHLHPLWPKQPEIQTVATSALVWVCRLCMVGPRSRRPQQLEASSPSPSIPCSSSSVSLSPYNRVQLLIILPLSDSPSPSTPLF
jgi:hypothetical protein